MVGGDARAEPRLQTSEVSCCSQVETRGVARCQPVKHGAQADSPEPCWHDDHKVCKSMWQSTPGLAAVSGTMSQDGHCCFEVIDVKYWYSLAGKRCKSCGLCQRTSSLS